MDVTEGVGKYKVGPRLVADCYGEGAEGCDQPDLAGVGSQGGIVGLTCLKGIG